MSTTTTTKQHQYLIYLAGPITGLSASDALDWRLTFIDEMPESIGCLNPLRGKNWLLEESSIKDNYESELLGTKKAILTRDYNDCKRSDLIIVNVLGATKASIGTAMEVAWAKAFDIPLILVIEPSGNPHDHAMLTEAASFRVSTLEDAIYLTEHILLAE